MSQPVTMPGNQPALAFHAAPLDVTVGDKIRQQIISRCIHRFCGVTREWIIGRKHERQFVLQRVAEGIHDVCHCICSAISSRIVWGKAMTIFYESNDESEEEIPGTRQQIGQVNKGHKRWSEKPAPNQQVRNRATCLCWVYNKRGTLLTERSFWP